MSKISLPKVMSLVIFLFLFITNVQASALSYVSVTLINNTDSKVIFCVNDVYKSTLSPFATISETIAPGGQKLDLIALNPSQATNSCSQNYAITDDKGLPAHNAVADTFVTDFDYSFSITQTSSTISRTVYNYILAKPTPTPGITGINVSDIDTVNSPYTASQICVDGVPTASKGNVVTISPGNHRIKVITKVGPNCGNDTSIPFTNIVKETTTKLVASNTVQPITKFIYKGGVETKQKPQIQAAPVISPSISNPSQTPKTDSPQDKKTTADKPEVKPEEKKETNPLTPTTTITEEPIAFTKLTIDRMAMDKIEDTELPTLIEDINVSTVKTTVVPKTVEWNIVSFMATMFYFIYDIGLYSYRKLVSSYTSLKS
jgi:hypothetical protein